MSNLNDSQRAQLLLLYKEKIQSLGDEAFFDRFDEIRRQCYEELKLNFEEEFKSYASQLGARGGKSKSEAKSKAARENGKKSASASAKKDSFNLTLEDI